MQSIANFQKNAPFKSRNIARFEIFANIIFRLTEENLMMTSQTGLSNEAQKLLKEILKHENDTPYWENRFNGLSSKEDAILRGCFKELKDNEMITYSYGDNIFMPIKVLKDGHLYEDQKSNTSSVGIKETLPLSKYDVFVSHANKDKHALVKKLYLALNELGVSIFYDEKSIDWGDNWKEKILEGTAKSEFAIIVISKNFFSREWTEKELSEFLSRQNKEGQKLILPILHNITIKQLVTQYPSLSDIQAISSKNYNCEQIALKFANQYIKRLKFKLSM